MNYKNVITGIFRERKNRFIATVEINGKEETCHVKNTGRLKELFIPGVTVGLSVSDNPERKTKYDVISVLKGDDMAAKEWIENGGLGRAVVVKPEFSYTTSDRTEKARFDFYVEFENGEKAFVEVKGVTLKEKGVALFPDAPTERGVKHLNALSDAVASGYKAYALFVIQMKGVHTFSPNIKTHLEFGNTLKKVSRNGVKIIAVDCISKVDYMKIDSEVKVKS